VKNLRGELGAGPGLNDIGSQDRGLGNLNEFGIVLGLSSDPGCGESIRDMMFAEERNNILETTVVGRVITSVLVTWSVAVTYCV
jgi:hypothetical protein